ncbi:MAG: hypothetical protein JNK65_08220, partial [Deltaproteobacteria bacterium]|nr:hypothetical protein [Deltaproteobacteria bacterium]
LALKSSNPKDLQKYVAFIQQGIERASNAILTPESEIKLEDVVENTSRLTKMAGYALEVLKEPALQAQCFETLQKVYKNLESKLAQKPEYQFLLKYAKAQLIKLKLFLSENPSFQDVHDFKETIKAAKLALKENSPQKEFFTSLIEKDLDLFKNIQAPSAKDLSRIFISRQTGSFIISLASQIDLKAGDSQKQVENRVETLMKDLSTQFLDHPDYSFSKALEVLKTPEAEHLKKLIQEKSVLRQLVECDKNIFLGKPDNSKPGNIISEWSDQVIKILEQHLSLSSQLTESEEVHRAAYQSILSQFSSKMGETHSPIAQSLFDFTREYPSNETSTSQKALQVSSQMTSTHFEIASGLSDFLSLKTAAFLVVTPLMNRALSGLILRRAGASGNLGKGFLTLVEEGELTKMGHLAVGGGVGMAFATSASLAQLKSDLGAKRESPWKNFIRNMIVGSFVNGAALGFGAAGSAALKKAYSNPALLRSLESAPVTSKDKAIFFMNRLLPHAGGVAIGSASMLGANALARGVFHNWTGVSEKEKVPYITTAEVTETILTMLALNLVEMGTNRLLVGQATHTADRVDPLLKFSLGEYRTQEILKISNQLAKEKFGETVLHNPKDCHDRPDMGAALLKHKQSIQKENYRQALFNRMALSALDGLPLKDIATPRYALFLEQQIKSQTSPDSLPPSSETPVIPPMPTPVETVAVKSTEREIPSGYTRVYLENGEGGQKRAKLAELL